MSHTLGVDHTVCTGAGTCEAMYPKLFKVVPEGYAVAVKTELDDPEDVQSARNVLDVCPTEAIMIALAGGAPSDDAA
ncbi:ferredoxin [Streptomyces sp. NPDC097619]|uniref:ferredoxin n=1 Tax=Streptomyces sp. NPDC097619 TaxID=3157228 RepID=UPI0033224CC8